MAVFICYSSSDRANAAVFYETLAAQDVPVWMDQADILPGANWQDSIDRAIRSCTHLLVLLSRTSVASKEVEAEWSLAKDLGKIIVPILLEPVDVPYRLRQHQHVPFSDGNVAQQAARMVSVLPRAPLPKITSQPLPRNAPAEDYAQLTLRLRGRHEDATVFVNPRRFPTLRTLLNELFRHCLAGLVAPYSYGSQWIIVGEPFSKGVVVPIQWVENPGKPVHEVAPDWQGTIRPFEAWIVPGSWWEVVVQEPTGCGGLDSLEDITARAYGIVTNNERVATALKTNAKAISILRNRFRSGTVADAMAIDCRHRLVFSDWLSSGLVGKVGIDTDEELSAEVERFLRW
jgi:hypothetical protein